MSRWSGMNDESLLDKAQELKKSEFRLECFIEFMKNVFGVCEPANSEKKFSRNDMERAFNNGWVTGIAHSGNAELLEALKDMYAQASGQPKSCGHAFACICPGEKARAAIAKSESR